MDHIKDVLSENCKESVEQTYDIYLLPPGEDPESCQSYLRMRNKDGKYNLMFEVCHSFFSFPSLMMITCKLLHIFFVKCIICELD